MKPAKATRYFTRNRFMPGMSGLLLLLWLLSSFSGHAQDTIASDGAPPVPDSLGALFPFLNIEKNRIEGDTSALRSFLLKLERIRRGADEQAVVVHIGDSHIQAGFVTKPVREWLQGSYGNSGPGLIFPYRVARSNGPPGYLSAADTPWIASRNAAPKKLLPAGVTGFTLWSGTSGRDFTIAFTRPGMLGSDTSVLTIFHAGRDTCYRFHVSDDSTGRWFPVVDSSGVDFTRYQLTGQPGKIRVQARKTSDSLRSATFYGLSVTNLRPGAVVHMIGVNGATYADYLHSAHFVRQLADLKPDLLIISLGTNEAANHRRFSSDDFASSVDSLIRQIRKQGIDAGMILTTPPGIYQRYRKNRRTHYRPNPAADSVSRVLKSYATDHRLCYWDWYTIMGGATGMSKWKSKKMTDRKYIHFSAKGYGIQGLLLTEALKILTVPVSERKTSEKP